ncbi:MAG: BamA/TamA family outer membrane protein [Acidobacteriota bacterium]
MRAWTLSLLLAAAGLSQIGPFEGKRITDIQYSVPGILHEDDLERVQPLRIGEPLRAAAVASAIDGLFATGRFNDISVEAENSPNGVSIRFVTEPRWFVGGVEVKGKASPPPNRGELTSTARFTLGAAFEDADLTRASGDLERLLRLNGLYESAVAPGVERSDDGQQVFITFAVKSGKRAKYAPPVIQGNPLLSDDAIIRATGWRYRIIHVWRKVTSAETRKGLQGIRGKYEQQDRLMASVQLEGLDYDAGHRRVTPRLNLNPGPKVEIRVTETKVSKRVLKRYVPVYAEHSVDTDLLVEGRRNLLDYFQSQGYYDADVDFRVQPAQDPPSADDVEVITYAISRGSRFRAVHVGIAGNRYFNTATIRERMFTQPASFSLRRGRYSGAFQRKDEENIADLYKSNGFRDVTVAFAVDRNYKGKPGDVAVTVNIDEGTQWLVDDLTIDGVSEPRRDEVASRVSAAPGQPFSEVSLAADRNALLTYYYERGYPSANVTADWRPGATPRHVSVVYTVSEGNPQFVRDVKISGLHGTRPSLVNRAMSLKAGDPLSPVRETDTQKRLYDLGIFARVDTAIQNPDGDTRFKYVLYNLEEANRYSLNVGLGAQVARFGQPSSESLGSPGGSTGFSPQVSFDVSRLNFLGIGHTVTLRASYSSLEKLGSITYLQPRFRNLEGRNISYSLIYDKTFDVRTFASQRQEASVQVSQIFSKSLTGLMRFSYRRVGVSNVIIPVLLIPQLIQPVRIGIFSANLVQDRRDNSSNPHRGVFNTADIGIASKYLGSQRSFARVLLRNATYYRITNNIVLARQTRFGVIAPFSAPAGVSAQQSVPLPERFYGGGGDSLRAFPYNQAGPRDTGAPLAPGGPTSQATGFPIGGNALLFNNVELRFPLLGENIQGVLFHDMGNVFSSLSDFSFRFRQANLQDFNYMVHAAGFGVRYKTPVGPIRLDLAYSINPPSYEGFSGTPQQLLRCNPNDPASLAQSFCQVTRQNTSHFQFFFSIGQTF